MQLAFQILFWICVGLMLHSYVLFPPLIAMLARGRKFGYLAYSDSDDLPMVFILFAVYNGETVLQKKLESMLISGYPSHKIKILVGSDASSDGTDLIVKDFSEKDARVSLHVYSRRGKANVLNELVKEVQQKESAKDNLILFSDVHAIFDEQTIFELVKYFKDPTVGIVGAAYVNTNQIESGISQQEKAYIQRENDIKYHESLCFGAMMGVYGACYTIPVADVPAFPNNILMEDFYITMWQLTKGKHSILNPEAKFYLNNPNSIEIEYRRKKRISAGNFQNLAHFMRLLLPGRSGVAFCFWSHKVLRWLGPFIMAAAFLCLIALQILGSGPYFWLAVAGESILALALLDILLQKININITLLRYANYFLQMNIALLDGFVWYIKGIKSNVWSPTKRNI